MKTTTALAAALLSVIPAQGWAQAAPIKVDYSLLLPKLHRYAVGDDARVALSRVPFLPMPGPGADVLTLTAPDGVDVANDQLTFTIIFSRDGVKLGEAVETCPRRQTSDCVDQLVLDVKSAAK